MTHAIIKTGGKQYLVHDGSVIQVEKLPTAVGKKITFKEVLLTTADGQITLGQPLVKGASVTGTVRRQARHDKVFGAKVKAKKRYRRYFGHKQAYTEVEITAIKTAA